MAYITITLPIIDVNEEEASITEKYFHDGDKVKVGDVILTIENTKATKDIVAEHEGFILYQCQEFETKKNGTAVALIFEMEEELRSYMAGAMTSDNGNAEIQTEINATKKAIALAEELKINLRDIVRQKGEGLIKEKDVEAFASQREADGKKDKRPVFELKRERVVIIGAGDGASVVIDILLDNPDIEIVGLVDDYVKEFKYYNYPVLDCSIDDFPNKYGKEFYDSAIIAIGSNLKSMQFRREIFEKYKRKGVRFTNAIARSAEIRRGVKIGEGNLIGAGCYIGTMTIIGDNNSISYGANIGHHNVIGSHNLIAPGVFTSGADVIGDSCILPAGVSMVNRATLGDSVVVPVGYAISQSIGSGKIIKNDFSH